MVKKLTALSVLLIAFASAAALFLDQGDGVSRAEEGGPVFTGVSTKGGVHGTVSTKLTGTQIGAGLKIHKINAGTGKLEPNPIECTIVTFTGTIPAGISTEATVAPTFGGACKGSGWVATVKTSGCFFRFYNPQKVKADVYGSTLELECETNKDLEVQMFSAADEKTEECKLTVQTANNTKLEGITFDDITTLNPLTDVVATIDTKLEYSQSGKCGVVKSAFATMTGEVTFTGDSEVTPTEAVDVEISG
ncbi:MAG: hypothetical protein ABW065_00940 [Solirubrobacterales bacterium]